jgi:sensor histidine kinase YesM
MIAQLSELLRQAFDRGDQAEVMLHEELRLIGHYVAIQEQRFGDRLHVTLHADPHAEGALVPALLLQPLVENAVTHGLAGRVGGRVSVRVHGTVAGGRLRLVVRDDGPGFGRGLGGPGRPYGLKRLDAPETREGVGLAGTRARLQERYGSAHRLDLTDAPGGGAEVMVEIPFVTHAGADR